jgi:hypothetical protein
MTNAKHQARQRRLKLRRQYEHGMRIAHSQPQRTLKRSARKYLERERTVRLWMAPWVTDLFWRSKRITYPDASLLGLPAELRQQILYEAMDMKELDRTAIEAKEVRPDGQEIRDDELWNSSTRAQMTEAITSGRTLARLQLTPREGNLIERLYRRIGELCCVSPVTRLDMVVVRTLWQRDLNRHLNSQYTVHLDTKLPLVAAGYE